MGTDPDELAAAATIVKALHNSQYTAVVANPPYLGSKHHSPLLKKFLGKKYTAHKADLITCFMTRGRTLVQDAGAWGMLTLNNWMFLSSFENSRKQLLNENTISTFKCSAEAYVVSLWIFAFLRVSTRLPLKEQKYNSSILQIVLKLPRTKCVPEDFSMR